MNPGYFSAQHVKDLLAVYQGKIDYLENLLSLKNKELEELQHKTK